jgi:predicted HicB family RNase H-like nuclease
VADVVKDLLASGELVPDAIAERRCSGELRVRIPPLVHRQLALQAAEEGVSLNRLASAKLAASGC